MQNLFHYFNSSPEVIRFAVMMYVRSPLSLKQVEDLLVERGIDVRHEVVLVEPFSVRCSAAGSPVQLVELVVAP